MTSLSSRALGISVFYFLIWKSSPFMALIQVSELLWFFQTSEGHRRFYIPLEPQERTWEIHYSRLIYRESVFFCSEGVPATPKSLLFVDLSARKLILAASLAIVFLSGQELSNRFRFVPMAICIDSNTAIELNCPLLQIVHHQYNMIIANWRKSVLLAIYFISIDRMKTKHIYDL